MKASILGLCLLIMSVQGSYAQQTSGTPSAAEQEVLNLSKQKWLWMADKNADSLNVLFNAKSNFVHMGGTWEKTGKLKSLEPGSFGIRKLKYIQRQRTSLVTRPSC